MEKSEGKEISLKWKNLLKSIIKNEKLNNNVKFMRNLTQYIIDIIETFVWFNIYMYIYESVILIVW